MDAIKLAAIFTLIICLMKMKRPLSFSIICGIAAACVLFGIGINDAAKAIFESITSWDTLSLILIFYLIAFLQRMLEKRDFLNLAHRSLNGLFNSRRINASLAPAFIGLLPSAGAVFVCGEMVKSACGNDMSDEDQTFITSYYRHIAESFLPTYSSIVIAIQLSSVPVSSFLFAMFPMVVVLMALGYIFYLRKLPKETGMEPSTNKLDDIKNMVKSLWTIALTIALILIFEFPVYTATFVSIVLCIFVHRFSMKELKPMFSSALEWSIVINTFVVMIFKEIIARTGAIASIPGIFALLPVPTVIVFALVFFFCTVISGSMATIALCMPLAYQSIPNGGPALLMLLMCYTYAAMQISPTHICLTLVTDYFHTGMTELLKRTVPVIASFCAIAAAYYLILTKLF